MTTVPSTNAAGVEQTILITISVICGVLFIALLGWGIWSTQRHVKDSMEGGHKEHREHKEPKERRRKPRHPKIEEEEIDFSYEKKGR